MMKVGRYTAAVVLLLVGGTVIADKALGTAYLQELVQWWPAILIALGVEYLYFNFRYGRSDTRLRLDIGGLIFSVVISSVVVGSMLGSDMTRSWFTISLGDALYSISEETGNKFDKGTVESPVAFQTDQIKVENPSGNVVLKPGAVDRVQVESVVWVDKLAKDEASTIAEQSKITFEQDGGTLRILAEGKEYGSGIFAKRKPRMNLIVTVPELKRVNFEVKLVNGKVEAAKLPVNEKFAATTVNGEIRISDLTAAVKLKTTNGKAGAVGIRGNVEVETVNGFVYVQDVQGSAALKAVNGEVKAERISGDVEAKTVNGAVVIADALQQLDAETTNGAISIRTRQVGGNWILHTSHGKIDMTLPSATGMTVTGKGKFSSVNSDFPLQSDRNRLQGQIGDGRFKLDIDTNGSVSIRQADM